MNRENNILAHLKEIKSLETESKVIINWLDEVKRIVQILIDIKNIETSWIEIFQEIYDFLDTFKKWLNKVKKSVKKSLIDSWYTLNQQEEWKVFISRENLKTIKWITIENIEVEISFITKELDLILGKLIELKNHSIWSKGYNKLVSGLKLSIYWKTWCMFLLKRSKDRLFSVKAYNDKNKNILKKYEEILNNLIKFLDDLSIIDDNKNTDEEQFDINENTWLNAEEKIRFKIWEVADLLVDNFPEEKIKEIMKK